MPLSLERFGFSDKLHHHHRRYMSEASLACLQAFRSQVSDNLHRLSESLETGSEFLSLRWLHRCFEMLPAFNNAFAKLMVEVDYPVSKWEAGSMEEYLDYSINLLELLNSISSSLSHLRQARVSLSHGLRLMDGSPDLAMEYMREIQTEGAIKELKASGGDEERVCTGKQKVFHEAMLALKTTAFWVCGVVLWGLKSDDRLLIEMRRRVFADSSLTALDSVVWKKMMEEGVVVKEVKDVNETVGVITSGGSGGSDAEKELKKRLELLGNALKDLKEEEEDLFAKIMAARNEVLETLRRNNQ